MKQLRILILKIDDELESAKDYAERYIELKAEGNEKHSKLYLKMAQDEIEHSKILYDEAVALYDQYKKISIQADIEILKKENSIYNEKIKRINLLLS
ncbi:MAG: hypothetical protein MJZ34_13510 [Paludibacteraceae bacterium]|nr:hypothetical protein [Paludibacteraceae bacterium]